MRSNLEFQGLRSNIVEAHWDTTVLSATLYEILSLPSDTALFLVILHAVPQGTHMNATIRGIHQSESKFNVMV